MKIHLLIAYHAGDKELIVEILDDDFETAKQQFEAYVLLTDPLVAELRAIEK